MSENEEKVEPQKPKPPKPPQPAPPEFKHSKPAKQNASIIRGLEDAQASLVAVAELVAELESRLKPFCAQDKKVVSPGPSTLTGSEGEALVRIKDIDYVATLLGDKLGALLEALEV